MGTRGFICFVIEGREKTAYNHCDSYPDGLGLKVLRWLRQSDIDVIREQARKLRVVSEYIDALDGEMYLILVDLHT